MPAFKFKLPSTFVLALVEEMLTPLNFSTQLSLKILAKQCKTAKKMHLTVELFNLAKARDFPNRLLCFTDVMFTWCHGKLGEFIPASKLASTFVPTFIGPRRFSPPPR